MRVFVDNVEERCIRVERAPGEWIDLPFFRPVIQSFELSDFCVLLFDDLLDDGGPAMAAWTFAGERLWERRADELPMNGVTPGRWHFSTMKWPDGRSEQRLNRGAQYCVVRDWRVPAFEPPQTR